MVAGHLWFKYKIIVVTNRIPSTQHQPGNAIDQQHGDPIFQAKISVLLACELAAIMIIIIIIINILLLCNILVRMLC